MSDDRLATHLWVAAHLSTASCNGVPMVVVRRGDRSRGAVLLKLFRPAPNPGPSKDPKNEPDQGPDQRPNQGATWSVLAQVRDRERLGWLRATGPDPVSEAEADRYIARQLRIDPDLWVIEVEDRLGRHWFDGDIVGSAAVDWPPR